MNISDIQIGMVVKYVADNNPALRGKIGKCVFIAQDKDVAVEFDEDISGHDCGGHCKRDHGWWCGAEELEPVEDTAEEVEPISVPLNVPGVVDYVEDVGECIRGLDVLGLKRREISSLFGDILNGYFHEKALQETIKRLEGGSNGV